MFSNCNNFIQKWYFYLGTLVSLEDLIFIQKLLAFIQKSYFYSKYFLIKKIIFI